MKKEDILKKLESEQGDTDYVLRSAKEEQSFLENYKTSVIEAEFDPQTSKIYKGIDDDIYSVLGERKKPTEKTYDFLKSKLSDLKTRAERVTELETEIATLKQSKPDSASRAEIKNLENEIKRIQSEYENKLTAAAENTNRTLVKSEIEKARKEIKLKSGIPDSVLDIYFSKITDDLVKDAQLVEGKVLFVDDNKVTRRNAATMLPFTAKEMLLERLPKDIIDVTHKQDGIPLPKDTDPVTKGKDGKLTLNFSVPAEVTTRQKLGEHLITLGVKRGTPEYIEAYKTYGKDLPPV